MHDKWDGLLDPTLPIAPPPAPAQQGPLDNASKGRGIKTPRRVVTTALIVAAGLALVVFLLSPTTSPPEASQPTLPTVDTSALPQVSAPASAEAASPQSRPIPTAEEIVSGPAQNAARDFAGALYRDRLEDTPWSIVQQRLDTVATRALVVYMTNTPDTQQAPLLGASVDSVAITNEKIDPKALTRWEGDLSITLTNDTQTITVTGHAIAVFDTTGWRIDSWEPTNE